MSLLDTVRAAVTIADTVTKSLQPVVIHEAFIAANAYGKKTPYADPVERRALVEYKQHIVRTREGQMVQSTATVTFLAPTPMDVRDILTLPNGRKPPILSLGGLVDAVTDTPLYYEVYL